ncbi:MAG: dTDP-4-dehydrorhamnose 3,5-epimerase [Rhodospirillales bacterium]|jgi:dTDP-4-dehydrorhamnose 3,5-epimerase|nr:dTDP-4-dehydrorhamnose 3,5-epimerase [Rhodospirillales bacterium]
MNFVATRLAGAFLIEIEPHEDERGSFARTWCGREFAARGLVIEIAQCSLSTNKRAGTVRGLHFQRAPHDEVKLVRCQRGAIFDVIVDLRPDSATFRRWQGFELSADNHRELYVPQGFAHGFQTLTDDAEIFYQISEYYVSEAAGGVRWDDPAFRVVWPLPISTISDKDRHWPDFQSALQPEHSVS